MVGFSPGVLRPGAQLVVGGGGGEGGVGEGPGGEAEGGVALAWNLKRIGLCFFCLCRSPDHVMVGVVVVVIIVVVVHLVGAAFVLLDLCMIQRNYKNKSIDDSDTLLLVCLENIMCRDTGVKVGWENPSCSRPP